MNATRRSRRLRGLLTPGRPTKRQYPATTRDGLIVTYPDGTPVYLTRAERRKIERQRL